MAHPCTDVSRTTFVLWLPFPRLLMQTAWKPLRALFLPWRLLCCWRGSGAWPYLSVCPRLSFVVESSWLPHAGRWHQKVSPLVKVCSLQSALHERSNFASLPLSRVLGPHQVGSFCSWSPLLNVLHSCTPCWMWASYTDISSCPLLLRQQGGENNSCLSMFAKRETAEASKCMLGEWCKQGVVACGLL